MTNLIIGSGITGITMANLLANKLNELVLLIDKSDHIGGKCYDYLDQRTNIMIHKYGPHIIHTNNKLVWDYLSNYTDWNLYFHKELTYVDSMYLNTPINLNTLNNLFPTRLYDDLTSHLLKFNKYDDEVKLNDLLIQKGTNHIVPILSNKFGTNSIIRLNKNNDYYTDKYQGIPLDGYTKMFNNMLNNKNILVELNKNYSFNIQDTKKYKRIIYTGSIDEIFKFKYGKLNYESYNYEHKLLNVPKYQNCLTVNYPNHFNYERSIEYKHLYENTSNETIVTNEYRVYDNKPYIPINNIINDTLYYKYYNELPDNVYVLGQIGQYKKMSIDECVLECFKMFDKISNDDTNIDS
jgi:UDP-galactopyranose mutase